MLDFSDPRFWLEVIVLIVTVANSFTIWLRQPGKDAKASVTALERKIELERRAKAETEERERQEVLLKLQHLEDRVAHMPTDEELATLHGEVHSIKAQLEGQRELLKRVEHQTTLIHEHLLRSK
jgi:hypothetical protein